MKWLNSLHCKKNMQSFMISYKYTECIYVFFPPSEEHTNTVTRHHQQLLMLISQRDAQYNGQTDRQTGFLQTTIII